MADNHRFGPSGILRSFLGAITGSLSSLPSNPFRWNLPSVPLLPYRSDPAVPPPPHHSEQNLQNWPDPTFLYPNLEMEETRKRMITATEDVIDVVGAESNKKQKQTQAQDEAAAAVNVGDTTAGDVHMASAESPCTSSATPNASSIIHLIAEENPARNERILTPKAENFEETLVGYIERISAAKKKPEKRGQDKGLQDIAHNKRIKVSKNEADMKALSGQKRNEPDDSFVSIKYEKKLKILTITEETQQKKDNNVEPSVAAASHTDNKLERSIRIHNLPLKTKKNDIKKFFSRYGVIESVNIDTTSVSHKSIITRKNANKDETKKTETSQTASVVYKDESSASAALSLNVKEFNGSYIFVTAASGGTQIPEDFSNLPYNLAHAAIISNLPSDIKDEDLLQTLHGYSSSIRIEALRVLRNAHPDLGATAHVVFKSSSNVYTVQLKSKDKTIKVSQVSTSRKRARKEPAAHTRKRSRDSKADIDSIQKKVIKSRDSKTEQCQLPINKNDNESDLTKNSGPDSLSGTKYKREERQQRGISRSKKIRRS